MGRVLETLGGVAARRRRLRRRRHARRDRRRLRANRQPAPRRCDSRRPARAAGLLLGPLRRGRAAGGPRPLPVRRAADARATGARRPAGRHPGLVRVGGVHAHKGGIKRPPFLMDSSIDMRGHAFLTSTSADEQAQESDRIAASYLHVLPAVRPARRGGRQPGPARDAAGGVSVRVAGDAGPHRAHAGRPAARRLRIRSDGHRRHGRHRRARDGVGPDPATRAERPHHRATARRRVDCRAAQGGRQHAGAGRRAWRLRRRDGGRAADLSGGDRAGRGAAHRRARVGLPRRRQRAS